MVLDTRGGVRITGASTWSKREREREESGRVRKWFNENTANKKNAIDTMYEIVVIPPYFVCGGKHKIIRQRGRQRSASIKRKNHNRWS